MMQMTQRALMLATLLASLSLPCHSFVSSAWYTGWHAQFLPPSQIPFSKYTSIQYAFAVTAQDGSISLAQSDIALLNQLVPLAHSNNVNVSLSIGGWTGSRFFSTAFNSDQGRTSFVNDAVNLVNTLQLDGLDFDWEYPNRQGIGCNNILPQDSSNFLTFLQQLRGQLPTKTLSAAVFIEPFAGPDGNPMSDVSTFAKVLDHIEIMNYDIFVSSQATTGPNSPLDDSCAPAGSPGLGRGSATSAVKAWTSAGFPADQIVLGVAAYGHSWTVSPQNAFVSGAPSSSPQPVSSTSGGPLSGLPQSVSQAGSAAAAFGLARSLGGLAPYYVTPLVVLAALAHAAPAPGPVPNLYRRETSVAAPVLNVYATAQVGQTPLGDSWDSTAGSTDACGNFAAGPTGLFNFWGLIEQGFLDSTGNPKQGIAFTRDACSQTPFVYDQNRQVMVSYDDPTSFAAKGAFIKAQGLKGFAMWELAGDSQTLLLDAIRGAAL